MIGKLRHRITFQKETRVDDGGGGSASTWGDISGTATVWASVEPLSGREVLFGQQLQASVTHRIKLRHKSDISEAMRIKFGSRFFNIRSIRHIEERDRWTEIMAEEGVAL